MAELPAHSQSMTNECWLCDLWPLACAWQLDLAAHRFAALDFSSYEYKDPVLWHDLQPEIACQNIVQRP